MKNRKASVAEQPSINSAAPSFTGLNTSQVASQRRVFGKNELEATRRNTVLSRIWDIVSEPMFLLLAIACVLYFLLGDFTEATMMVVSILFVTGIELYQETKSERALEALRQFTKAQVRVLRNGVWIKISSEDLVPEDIVSIEEGERIPADGILLEQHDLSVDESVLTGESLPVEKSATDDASTAKSQQSTAKSQRSTSSSKAPLPFPGKVFSKSPLREHVLNSANWANPSSLSTPNKHPCKNKSSALYATWPLLAAWLLCWCLP